ncbi:MAG TPA: hypothetical protein VI193_12330, partial [Acidimicrobiia bacterium]
TAWALASCSAEMVVVVLPWVVAVVEVSPDDPSVVVVVLPWLVAVVDVSPDGSPASAHAEMTMHADQVIKARRTQKPFVEYRS